MKLSEFLEGLTILKPHYKGGDGFHLGAEHDVFYAYATDTPLTTSEVERMVELGWFQEEAIVDDDGEFKAANYIPEEGWQAYV